MNKFGMLFLKALSISTLLVLPAMTLAGLDPNKIYTMDDIRHLNKKGQAEAARNIAPPIYFNGGRRGVPVNINGVLWDCAQINNRGRCEGVKMLPITTAERDQAIQLLTQLGYSVLNHQETYQAIHSLKGVRRAIEIDPLEIENKMFRMTYAGWEVGLENTLSVLSAQYKEKDIDSNTDEE